MLRNPHLLVAVASAVPSWASGLLLDQENEFRVDVGELEELRAVRMLLNCSFVVSQPRQFLRKVS